MEMNVSCVSVCSHRCCWHGSL